MPSVLAFFPWVAIEEPLTIGRFRLLPFEARKKPGNLPNVTQVDIDGVLKAYSKRPIATQTVATLLEVGAWRSGRDASPKVVSALFKARHLIAFAALAERRLFVSFQYTNFDTYALVIQRFQPGEAGTFAFMTRRRDGGTNQLWSSDRFAFYKPHHVEARARVDLDRSLLLALSRLPKGLFHVFEAIQEFNAANTDSSDVMPYVEVVMVKSALEWLFEIDERAKALQDSLRTLLQDIPPLALPGGVVAQRWERKWKKWNNPRPIEAWARDFCAVRATAAHGLKRNAKGASVWSANEHLAFASMLFPLLVKKVLKDAGLLKMKRFDIERLRRIDRYLMYDPFALSETSDRHSWIEIDNSARFAGVR